MLIKIRIAANVRPEDRESVIYTLIHKLSTKGVDLSTVEFEIEIEEYEESKTLDPILLN